MKQKIKKMWLSALKSGKYKQGKAKLCHGGPQGARYCCLGVLSDLAVKHGGVSRREAFKDNSLLNSCVMEWAGLTNRDPQAESENGDTCLSSLNDDFSYSFNQIASVINKSL